MTYLPILTYHRLLAQDPTKAVDPKRISVSQNQFHSHLAWLKRLGYNTLALPNYVRRLQEGGIVRPRTFAITFDDGYEEVLRLGLPVLQEFNFTATVFAVPGEAENRWDDGRSRLMNATELQTWRKSGMDVGAHTSHHVHLPKVDPATQRQETIESKRKLEEILGEPVTTFAYPYGEYDEATKQAVQEAGFEAAFATDNAPRDHAGNLFRLRRTIVFPRNNVWEILWKAQTWYPAYQDWKSRRATRDKGQAK